MPTQTDIDRDYRRLKILLEATDSFVLTFALYRDAKEQRENAGRLREMLELPITQVALKGDNLNPVRTFLDLPKEPRQAIFFTFLGSSLPEGKSDFDKFAGYVNIQREAFTDAPHAVVLWLREEQLVRLMRRAPDFWAWRSGVFDFRGELTETSTPYRDLEFANFYEKTQLEEQVNLYREILKSQLQQAKPDLAYVIRTRLRLSDVLYKLGLYEKMASEAREALSVAQALDDKTPVADAFNKLAIAYHKLNRRDEAELFYRKAIKLLKEIFGSDINYIIGLSNLAGLLTEMRRYDEAEVLFKEATELAERTSVEEHLSYILTLFSFAKFFEATRRYTEAEPLYRKAINAFAETLDGNHSAYAISYAINVNSLAGLLIKMERYDEAERLYKEAIETAEETTLSKEYPTYIITLYDLVAVLLMKTGRYDEAEIFFRKALKMCRGYLEETHPNTKVVEENYQRLRQERFDTEQAVGKTA